VLLRLRKRWQIIVMSTSVHLSVSPTGYLQNHTRDLYQFFCVCCLCLATVKVIVGLASHWPCVTDLSGLFTYGLKALSKGDKHSINTPHGVWYSLPLSSNFINNCNRKKLKYC